MNAPSPLLAGNPSFDEAWLEIVEWRGLDRAGELSRWRVRDARAGRQWLVVRASPRASLWELARLDREYALGPGLAQPWAVPPLARLSTAEGPLLVLDEDGGRPLSAVAAIPLSVERFLQLAIGASSALAQMHRHGMLHRDIRPDNLILGRDGVVRLTGFAFTARADGCSEGTPPLPDASLAYLPPEQSVSPRGDLYALGVSFFELLSGRLPFSATDPVRWLHQHVAVPAPTLSQHRPGLPPALDDLLAWLMAKQPGQRPDSAQQLEVELRRCLDEWRENGSISRVSPTTPGNRATDLVGRTAELETLRSAVARLRQGLGGAVLISGEAGIGKTSLVRQLRREQDAEMLLFANGKCELSRHRLPYAALSAALSSLFARLAGETPDQVSHWRQLLREAVGHNGDLLARLIPELEWLTGALPSNPNPPPVSEARRHLHGMLQRLLAVLAGQERPLLLFLDDVQWLDEESATFLVELPPSSFDHLLLIAAYRPEDSQAPGSLTALLEQCRSLGARTREIALQPLSPSEIGALLQAEPDLRDDEQALLAEHLQQRGNGNPLYLTQLSALLRETASGERDSQSLSLLDDVTTLLQMRLQRLPQRTREVLGALAILGNQTPLPSLAAVHACSPQQLLQLLRPAFKAGLVVENHEGLSFSHDIVWESARAAIPAAEHGTMGVEFASALLALLPEEDAEAEAVFRVATQMLRIGDAPLQPEQRQAFIALLMRAARLAMAAAAAATALDYLQHAQHLLAAQSGADPELARELALLIGQGLILNADYVMADQHASALLECTEAPLQRAELYRFKCEIRSLRGDYAGAVATAIAGLSELGVSLPLEAGQGHAEQAWLALQIALHGRAPEVFAELPEIANPDIQAVIELLSAVVIPGSFIAPDLMLLSSCRIASLTLHHGMCTAAVHALAWLGVAAAHHLDQYQLGYQYAATARRLTEQPRHTASRVAVLVALDQVSVWTRPLPFALECAESAFRASLAQGSPSFACYANNHIVSDLLVLGAPIERMLRQIDAGLVLARNLEFIDAQSILHAQARYIRRLAGDSPGSIPIPPFEELAERVARSSMGPLHFWWQLFEGLLHFLEGDFEGAAAHLDQAWTLTWAVPAHIHLIDLALFSVLNRAALQTASGRPQEFDLPMQHLRLWAELNPRYFSDRLALAEAELLRLQGRNLEALQGYEEAVAKAEQCGAIHLKGLSHEMAARGYQSLGLQVGAQTHLRQARDAWRRWGAKTLAQQLETEHAFLREQPAPRAGTQALQGNQQLDLLSITRACQALSREIEPDALIETLLANAAMHAGATYTALLLNDEGGLQVAATGLAGSRGIDVRLRPPPSAVAAAPLSLVRHAMRQREPLLLSGTDAYRRFGEDAYLARVENGSLLCVPLLKQNEAIGALYLENCLTQGAFEPARVDVLELLAAQAAISLSTARLYGDLLAENQRRRDSEGTLQRTQALLAIGQAVSHYGTFLWRHQSERSFWSPQLVAELGLPVPADDEHLRDAAILVHADDRPRFVRTLDEALRYQQAFRLEFRTVALDGTSRHLELAGEPDGSDTFIGVVCDISQRRQAEVALRAARAELDRTSQATMLGELAASIAHEINQPLASILSNAGASLRWLDRPQPSLEDALEGLRDILDESQRAADIVRAMRTLARRKPLARKALDLEPVIRQVLEITRADLEDKHVGVTLQLAPALPVLGDTIQLQQVLRNLISNAVEAMLALPPSTRHLSIQARLIGQEVLVTVEDSGPGVPAEKLGKVFQAFFSTKATGMGMGLAICASIISAHSGVLGATRGRHDENLFFFTLPGHSGG
ncbi:trifunctional serine/threonine-protein kinase/ATP-binding protein/sensor histidine kinase [Pseudomonas sp. Gutcm_11s]|uniref:trifunctional serine/threonine-protein kinase/ATP-binding protein/sensor histidine kinase n=1 Tax=Pseudomonas sp. Gutcm_11s TaxID=3026088 RepID=UPI00235E0E53|nr:AAA family ATPase [Pseudomonas sp. Gutcm_11s]MDD0842718.1 AAA family ATPase [Pseudomonas sp. Gutcm_11s]